MNLPLIGIPCDVRTESRPLTFVFENYLHRVEEAGGLPLLIPPLIDPTPLDRYLDLVDAILIVGGEDIDPREYGEEPLPTHEPIPAARGRFDLALARRVLERRMPVLGVCYGCQLLGVASGGALWQDVPSQVPGAANHGGRFPDLPRHEIALTPGTRLRSLMPADRVTVNTAHHQAVRSVGAGWSITAHADDGVAEAIERDAKDGFALGVEWHPELMPEQPEQRGLFEALVAEGARAREARA